MAKNPNKIRAKRVASDYVIDIIMIVTIVLVLVLTLYPFLNALAISLNDSNDTTLGGLTIYPRKFTWRNYELVFTNQKIWMAYFITIARTVIGTVGGETARVNIPVYADQIAKWADELSKQFDLDFSTMVDSLNNFNWSSILSGATEFTTNFFSSLVNVTVNVASGIFTFVLSVIFSAYFLTSKESLLLSLKRVSYSLLPKKVVATLADIAVTSNNVFSSFVRGQLTECVILGCLCFICMSLIGFDYALLISCIVTITALIPILGAYIGCGIGAFLLLIVNPMDAVWFVIFFICLQQFEGNLIYPKVVGSTIGLPGVWVMTAVTIFSNLFGILGIILGTPIAAVLYTVMRRVTTNRLAARGLSNADLEPGKYPYLENSHYASGYSKGRPLCAPVLERAAKKKEQGKKPLFPKFKTSKKK